MRKSDVYEYQTKFKKFFDIEELNKFAKHNHIVEWKCAVENNDRYVYIVQYNTGKLLTLGNDGYYEI